MIEGSTLATIWSNVPCSGSDSSTLLIFDNPTLNNEIVSSKKIIIPIENSYGSILKIKSSSSSVELSIKW